MKTYKVLREQQGDAVVEDEDGNPQTVTKIFQPGDTRELTVTDAVNLVGSGALGEVDASVKSEAAPQNKAAQPVQNKAERPVVNKGAAKKETK